MQNDELTPLCFAICPLQILSNFLARYDVMGRFYELVSLRRVAPPPGAKGANWHRYVIALNGTETIHGHKRGSIKDVTKEVEEIVAGLNQRHRKSTRAG